MPDCDSCYDPACARSLNAAAPCNCTDFFNVVRLANNSYTNAVFNALPATAASITTGHLDALRGHSNVLQVVALTPAAVALYNGGAVLAAPHPQAGQAWYMAVDGTAFGDLGSMIEIFKNHEGERTSIKARLENLSFSAANQGQRSECGRALERCEKFETVLEKSTGTIAASADEFDNAKYPLARLYHLITKASCAGPLTMAQSGLTSGRLDGDTGKPVLTFEKLKGVDDINSLHLIWRDFEAAVMVIGKNGSRASWAPFFEIMYSLCRTKADPGYLHELMFEALSFVDLKPAINIRSFVTTHWQTFLITFEAKWRENDPPGGDGSDPPGGKGKKREHVKFGPVTKQGEAAGEMRTRNGAVAFCNKWNSREDCTLGVFAGSNKGKCAYTHKCRYCMRTDHRGEDKHPVGHAQAGQWVCSRHH